MKWEATNHFPSLLLSLMISMNRSFVIQRLHGVLFELGWTVSILQKVPQVLEIIGPSYNICRSCVEHNVSEQSLMFLSYITPREGGCYCLQSTFSLFSILKKNLKIKSNQILKSLHLHQKKA